MNIDELINSITPDVYEKLKRAVELGKWPDGVRLTKEQREQCMQAVIAYDVTNLSENKRVGHIDKGPKKEGELCDSEAPNDQVNPIKFIK